MNITITFRHMAGTDAMKSHAHEKFAKLQKFLRQPMSAQVTLSVEGLEKVTDVRIASGGNFYQATERSEDMYASMDMVVDKLERQINAAKGAHVARKRGAPNAGEFAVEVERQGLDASRSRT